MHAGGAKERLDFDGALKEDLGTRELFARPRLPCSARTDHWRPAWAIERGAALAAANGFVAARIANDRLSFAPANGVGFGDAAVPAARLAGAEHGGPTLSPFGAGRAFDAARRIGYISVPWVDSVGAAAVAGVDVDGAWGADPVIVDAKGLDKSAATFRGALGVRTIVEALHEAGVDARCRVEHGGIGSGVIVHAMRVRAGEEDEGEDEDQTQHDGEWSRFRTNLFAAESGARTGAECAGV